MSKPDPKSKPVPAKKDDPKSPLHLNVGEMTNKVTRTISDESALRLEDVMGPGAIRSKDTDTDDDDFETGNIVIAVKGAHTKEK